MTHRLPLAFTLAACFILSACREEAPSPPPPAATDATAVDTTLADTAAVDTAATPPEAPEEDESPAGAEVDDEPAPAGRPRPRPPFEGTAGVVDVPRSGAGAAVLRDVRTGRQAGFDRVVFEFEGSVPGYHVEYVDRPVRQCGSGTAVEVAGDGWLEVRMMPAHAHTEAGRPTIERRKRSLRYPVLRELESTCDFEAVVTWVLGVASPNRYRVLELQDPPRLVVDIRHPAP